jgi:hypothetical protein
MAIKLERDKNGNVVAIDDKTNKKVGAVVTMGDLITEENKKDN